MAKRTRKCWIDLHEPVKPLGRQKQAELWLNWKCERDGIELPRAPIIRFQNVGIVDVPEFVAIIYENLSRAWKYETVAGGELMRIAVPAYAMPCRRADLWHAAHQAGASASDCYAEGQGWNVVRAVRPARWEAACTAAATQAAA